MTKEEFLQKYGPISEFIKRNPNDKTIWVCPVKEMRGRHLFTFDKKTFFNLFSDFPDNMTDEEIRLFCKENPFWVKEFNGFNTRLRNKGYNPETL